MSPYRAQIATLTDVNPAWVEAWMRTSLGTLDGLSAAEFRTEVRAAEVCIRVSTDAEYVRLWGTLNLTLCAWLYRQLVLAPVVKAQRRTRLTRAQFVKAMMALSASGDYLDWLVGRSMRERDRAPAYVRIKALVVRRLAQEMDTKPTLPSPAWSLSVRAGGGV